MKMKMKIKMKSTSENAAHYLANDPHLRRWQKP